MRTLISKLNDIRDTRISGILRNRFERISTGIVDLSREILHSEYLGGVLPEPMPATAMVVVMSARSGPATTAGNSLSLSASAGDAMNGFGKPLNTSDGKHASDAVDQTCPWHLRSMS